MANDTSKPAGGDMPVLPKTTKFITEGPLRQVLAQFEAYHIDDMRAHHEAWRLYAEGLQARAGELERQIKWYERSEARHAKVAHKEFLESIRRQEEQSRADADQRFQGDDHL